MNALEVHHIFPKGMLYRHGFSKSQVNAIANFCFLTKDTNLQIRDLPPSEYFPEIEARLPGALASQWIPMDEDLWETGNYLGFLEERQRLLAQAANALLGELLHDGATEHAAETTPDTVVSAPQPEAVPGGIADAEEEAILMDLNEWVQGHGLPEGRLGYELSHPDTGHPLAILDLAWPNGLQDSYSQPVALLLGEEPETLQIANDHGFRHFTSADAFRRYAEAEVLVLTADGEAVAAGG